MKIEKIVSSKTVKKSVKLEESNIYCQARKKTNPAPVSQVYSSDKYIPITVSIRASCDRDSNRAPRDSRVSGASSLEKMIESRQKSTQTDRQE